MIVHKKNELTEDTENEIELINKDGEILVSSREVAEHFGKRHDHVMRDLNKCKKDIPNFGEMFLETKMPDSYGRNQKVCLMNRDGFTLLAMGFTGKKALEWKLKYINAFNEMERQLNSPELQMARALLTAQELIKSKDNQINMLEKQTLRLEEKNEDQVKLLALAMGNNDRYIVRDIAKFYDMSSITFNRLLNELKIQKKVNKIWVLRKKYEDKPYMVGTTKNFWENNQIANKVQFNAWTNEELKFLYEVLKKNGYLPNI